MSGADLLLLTALALLLPLLLLVVLRSTLGPRLQSRTRHMVILSSRGRGKIIAYRHGMSPYERDCLERQVAEFVAREEGGPHPTGGVPAPA